MATIDEKAGKHSMRASARVMREIREHIDADIVLRVIMLVMFIACLVIEASTMPAIGSQCAPPSEIATSRTRWAALRKQLVNAPDHDSACRAFAASFYESVMTRQAVATCARDADRNPDISALDSEIDAFNDLLAAKCGS